MHTKEREVRITTFIARECIFTQPPGCMFQHLHPFFTSSLKLDDWKSTTILKTKTVGSYIFKSSLKYRCNPSPDSRSIFPFVWGLSQYVVITIGHSPASWILNKLCRRQPTAIIGNFLKHSLKGMFIWDAFNNTLWLNSANKSSHSQFRSHRTLRERAISPVALLLCLAHQR